MPTDKIAKLIEVSEKATDPDFKRIWKNKIRQLTKKLEKV
jgi:hypothetical protein|tara:strand:- start:1493 stop:1612 length:120 start_codon:yes stop_codon:yes gene_type:complete